MAAGLGFKTFTTGEVLTAADTNGYLMQGINVFASTAARDAAITSPQEGQFAYTKDTNSLWYYTGSAWAASGATGDIEGVTAGTGISGGGTSGTVTITNSMATEIAAKGDLIVGTGAATFDNLTVGSNNQILVADSTASTGLKWATPSSGGKVLQVVSAETGSYVQIASTTLTDTNITATITPTSATSKVWVTLTACVRYSSTANNSGCYARLMRGATSIRSYGVTAGANRFFGATNTDGFIFLTIQYLDSPATTSATTYKLQSGVQSTANSAYVEYQLSGEVSNITLLEIGA